MKHSLIGRALSCALIAIRAPSRHRGSDQSHMGLWPSSRSKHARHRACGEAATMAGSASWEALASGLWKTEGKLTESQGKVAVCGQRTAHAQNDPNRVGRAVSF